MKIHSTAFIVLASLLFLAPAASAQTFGIRLAAGRTAYAFGGEAFRRAVWGDAHSLSAGIYYERPLWKRLGFSTGINYLQLRDLPYTGFAVGPGPELVSQNQTLLEAPLYLHLQLAPSRQKTWSLQLLGGYSYGRIFSIAQYGSDGAQRIRVARSSRPDHPDYHFFNAGVECSYRFRNRQTVSLGLQQRMGWRPVGGGYSEKSRDYCIVLKTGIGVGRCAAFKK